MGRGDRSRRAVAHGRADDAIFRLWPPDRHQSAAVRAALRALLDHASPVVRGGALAALELADEEVETPDAETWLRAARDAREPLVRLAASASLHRRGKEDALGPLTQALASGEYEEAHFAAWLAGRLRPAGAIGPLVAALETVGFTAAHALVAIGGEDAWHALRAWQSMEGQNACVTISQATRRVRSADGAKFFLELWRRSTTFTEASFCSNALLPFDSPEANHARAEIGLDLLRLCPQEKWMLISSFDALVKEGRLVEARDVFGRLESRSAPTAWLEEYRMRLLAAEGDLDGARRARDTAVRRLERVRALELEAWQLPFEMAQLYAGPASIADLERARSLLDAALRLAPGEPEVLEEMKSLEGARGDK